MRDGRERAVVIAGSAPEPVPPTVDGERRREHDLGDVSQRRGDRGSRRLEQPAVGHRQRRPRLVRRPLQVAFRETWQQHLDVAAPQVVAPLVATAVIVGRGVPHALNTSAANRLTAAEAAASSWVQQTCVQVRLAAEVLARETAALSGPSRESAAADIVDRHLADYAVVTSPSGAIITQSGSLNGASPAFADLKPCSAAS